MVVATAIAAKPFQLPVDMRRRWVDLWRGSVWRDSAVKGRSRRDKIVLNRYSCGADMLSWVARAFKSSRNKNGALDSLAVELRYADMSTK